MKKIYDFFFTIINGTVAGEQLIFCFNLVLLLLLKLN